MRLISSLASFGLGACLWIGGIQAQYPCKGMVAIDPAKLTEFGTPYCNPSNGHLYFPTKNRMSIGAAMSLAHAVGGYVLSLDEPGEEAWVNNTFGGTGRWLGLARSGAGTFDRWMSGAPITSTNWCPGEPNNQGGVERYASRGWCNSTRWNDHSSAFLHDAIIEVPVSRLCLYAATSGHVFLEITPGVGPVAVAGKSFRWGFYGVAWAKNSFFGGLGTIRHEIPKSWSCRQCYFVSTDQAIRVHQSIQADYIPGPPPNSNRYYHLLRYNCMDWLAEKVAVIGIQLQNYRIKTDIGRSWAEPFVFEQNMPAWKDCSGGTFPPAPEPETLTYNQAVVPASADPKGFATLFGLAHSSQQLTPIAVGTDSRVALTVQGLQRDESFAVVDWGDGAHGNDVYVASHVYRISGTYDLRLLAIDTGAIREYHVKVAVAPNLGDRDLFVSVPASQPSQWVNHDLGPSGTVIEGMPVSRPVGIGCGNGAAAPLLVSFGHFSVNASVALEMTAAPSSTPGVLIASAGSGYYYSIGVGCSLYCDIGNLIPVLFVSSRSDGTWSMQIPIPAQTALIGKSLSLQAIHVGGTGPLGLALSNGIEVVVGG
ncbi:MAG: hypothetical protein H6832_02770 [Planctomycetes bacterium]|nr:hypothetical protein [Planctomycetota bacterium]MCB9890746.1 hypothetical protein [Planctomycetota bacterium]MCB9917304.1 hypothetical protein [Planctomycetota bacterium]